MPGWISRLIEREREGLRRRRVPGKWELKLAPELARFGDAGPDSRAMFGRLVCYWRGILLAALLTFPVYYGYQTLFLVLMDRHAQKVHQNPTSNSMPHWSLFAIMPVGHFVCLIGVLVLGVVLSNRLERRYLRRRLRERGVILCIPCGHDMTGTGAERCAECGKPLALRAPRHD